MAPTDAPPEATPSSTQHPSLLPATRPRPTPSPPPVLQSDPWPSGLTTQQQPQDPRWPSPTRERLTLRGRAPPSPPGHAGQAPLGPPRGSTRPHAATGRALGRRQMGAPGRVPQSPSPDLHSAPWAAGGSPRGTYYMITGVTDVGHAAHPGPWVAFPDPHPWVGSGLRSPSWAGRHMGLVQPNSFLYLKPTF